jgi:hypothetical protein
VKDKGASEQGKKVIKTHELAEKAMLLEIKDLLQRIFDKIDALEQRKVDK